MSLQTLIDRTIEIYDEARTAISGPDPLMGLSSCWLLAVLEVKKPRKRWEIVGEILDHPHLGNIKLRTFTQCNQKMNDSLRDLLHGSFTSGGMLERLIISEMERRKKQPIGFIEMERRARFMARGKYFRPDEPFAQWQLAPAA